MLHPVIVVLECASSVVRRIDVNAFDLSSEFLFQGFEGEKIVTEHESILEQVLVCRSVHRVIGPFRVF
jgi:hypothetical protein